MGETGFYIHRRANFQPDVTTEELCGLNLGARSSRAAAQRSPISTANRLKQGEGGNVPDAPKG
jgi:hypothetical protein